MKIFEKDTHSQINGYTAGTFTTPDENFPEKTRGTYNEITLKFSNSIGSNVKYLW